eukprot:723323_1
MSTELRDQSTVLLYDTIIVNQLVDLEFGTREECIKASLLATNCNDIDDVAEQLLMITQQSRNEDIFPKTEQKKSKIPYTKTMEDYDPYTMSKETAMELSPLIDIGYHFDELVTAFHLAKGSQEGALAYLQKNGAQPNNLNEQMETDESKHGDSHCTILQRLKQRLDHYSHSNQTIDSYDASRMLFDHLHVVKVHSSEEDERERMGICDIQKCLIFRRNYRNRDELKDSNKRRDMYNQHTNPKDVAFYQIIDKIHCHYFHRDDVGNGVPEWEINNIQDEEQKQNNDDVVIPINHRMKKMSKLILKKRVRRNIDILKNRNIGRFQLSQQPQEDNAGKMYKFGYQFIYGLKHENAVETLPDDADFDDIFANDEIYHDYTADDAIKVDPKYMSFKEELLKNAIYVMTKEQFDSELIKGETHFNSQYRKFHLDSNESWHLMTVHNILSIMIYCNYDILQCEFSKTYRENTEQHNEFYHLGKYLKQTVHTFGQRLNNCHKCYHGINDVLWFPAYIENIYCYGPLSTTSSLAVAINFANSNGLVVQFTLESLMVETKPNFFATSWLSDYSSEKEKLFIQNYLPLGIENITDVSLGFEYAVILKVLKAINTLYISNDQKIWISALIELQISYTLPDNHREFNLTVSALGRQMVNQYFSEVKSFEIVIDDAATHCIKKMLMNEQTGFVPSLYLINIAFPKIEEIYITSLKPSPINLSSNLMDTILLQVQNDANSLQKITIWVNSKSELSIADAMSEYQHKFMEFGYFVQYRRWENDEILIQRKEKSMIQLMENSLSGMNEIDHRSIEYSYEFNVDNNIRSLLQRLIQNRLSDDVKQDTDVDNQIVKAFDEHCESLETINVFWKIFNAEKNKYVSQLLCRNDLEWLDLGAFSTLFPNVNTISIWDAKLDVATMQSVYKYLLKQNVMDPTATGTVLQEINIIPSIGNSELTIYSALQIYHEHFKGIKSQIMSIEHKMHVSRGIHPRNGNWCFEMMKTRKQKK